jgi:hypothetical protein
MDAAPPGLAEPAPAQVEEVLEKERTDHALTRAERDALRQECCALEARVQELEEVARLAASASGGASRRTNRRLGDTAKASAKLVERPT